MNAWYCGVSLSECSSCIHIAVIRMKQNVQISKTLLIWENILPSDLSTDYGKHGAISDYSNHPWMGTGLHTVAPAVDDPLSAVQNAPHICLLSLCLRRLQRRSLSSADSDALLSLSHSILWCNFSSDACHIRPDLISGDRSLRIEVYELSDTRVCKKYWWCWFMHVFGPANSGTLRHVSINFM